MKCKKRTKRQVDEGTRKTTIVILDEVGVRRPNSTLIPIGVHDMRLSTYGFACYCVFKRRADDGDRSHLTSKQIALAAGISVGSAHAAQKELHTRGLLLLIPALTAEAAAALLRGKSPQSFGRRMPLLSRCSWCRARTYVLHTHHYPVPKARQGTDTVPICQNCHAEFHFLTRDRYMLREDD